MLPLKICLAFLLISILHYTQAKDVWVWKNSHRRNGAYHGDLDDLEHLQSQNEEVRDKLFDRIERQREREPTTRRPNHGVAQNDDIDDYPDTANMNDGTRNYPFGPNAYNGGQFNGFSGYPGFGYGGSATNGLLVGPGGPTGIIGRPQQYYPGAQGAGYPQGGLPVGAQGGFPTGQGGFPPNGLGGFPSQGGAFGNGNSFAGAPFPPQGQLPQEAGLNPAFGGQYPGGQFAGAGAGAGAQFPGGQFGGGQFVGQFPGNQFGGAQYPGAGGAPPYANGAQFPGSVGGGGPQYTEGYGLAYTNGFSSNNGPSSFNYNGYPGNLGYSNGFDEQDIDKRNFKLEGKSANVESRKPQDKNVDDKVSKSFNKT